MGVTARQVQTTCVSLRVTPRRRSSRLATTSPEEEQSLVAWVQLSEDNRQMRWARVAERFGWSIWVVQRIFRANGF